MSQKLEIPPGFGVGVWGVKKPQRARRGISAARCIHIMEGASSGTVTKHLEVSAFPLVTLFRWSIINDSELKILFNDLVS